MFPTNTRTPKVARIHIPMSTIRPLSPILTMWLTRTFYLLTRILRLLARLRSPLIRRHIIPLHGQGRFLRFRRNTLPFIRPLRVILLRLLWNIRRVSFRLHRSISLHRLCPILPLVKGRHYQFPLESGRGFPSPILRGLRTPYLHIRFLRYFFLCPSFFRIHLCRPTGVPRHPTARNGRRGSRPRWRRTHVPYRLWRILPILRRHLFRPFPIFFR